MFVVVDIWFHRKDKRVTLIGEPPLPPDKLRVQGNINFLLLGGVIAAILIASQWKPGIAFDIYGTKVELQELMRDGTLIAIAILSLVLTPNEHRDSQRLHLGADPRGRDPVRRHLRLHRAGAGDAAGGQGRRVRLAARS